MKWCSMNCKYLSLDGSTKYYSETFLRGKYNNIEPTTYLHDCEWLIKIFAQTSFVCATTGVTAMKHLEVKKTISMQLEL